MKKSLTKRITGLAAKIHIAMAVMMCALAFTGVSAAASTGAFTVTGGTDGTSYQYSAGVLTVLNSDELTVSTGGAETSDRIVVASSDGANIILDGVNINTSSGRTGALIAGGSGDVTVILAAGSDNVLTSGGGYAGLQKENSGKLILCGDGMLTATGGDYGAGIGGGDSANVSDIYISGGIISAQGGKLAAGIGSGTGSENGGGVDNIVITGGSITAKGNGGAGIGSGTGASVGRVVIEGGSVLALESTYSTGHKCYPIGGGLMLPTATGTGTYGDGSPIAPDMLTNLAGERVYLIELDNPLGEAVELNGTEYLPSTHYGEGVLYMYLSAKQHTIEVGGTPTEIFYNPDSGQWTTPGTQLDISGGVHGTDYIYPADTGILKVLTDTPLIITNASAGSATDTISVADGVSADLTLSSLSIETASGAALTVTDTTGQSSTTITLVGDNSLITTAAAAALVKNGGGQLTITGSGTLTASGEYGIGGTDVTDITIDDTTVYALGTNGAGIGGSASVGNITINNATVRAEGTNGAGIGSVNGAVGGTIRIISSTADIIGSGAACGIGGTSSSDVTGASVVIGKGSVNIVKGDSAPYQMGGTKEIIATDTMDVYIFPVYLLNIDNPTGAPIKIDGEDYPINKHSEGDPSLYLFLSATEHLIDIGGVVTPYYFDNSLKQFRRPAFTVKGGNYDIDYSFESGVLIVKKPTALTIENYDKTAPTSEVISIADGVAASLTFNGVSISSTEPALALGAGSSLKLRVEAGSSNLLGSTVGGINASGLEVQLSGTGTLEVLGGAAVDLLSAQDCTLIADTLNCANAEFADADIQIGLLQGSVTSTDSTLDIGEYIGGDLAVTGGSADFDSVRGDSFAATDSTVSVTGTLTVLSASVTDSELTADEITGIGFTSERSSVTAAGIRSAAVVIEQGSVKGAIDAAPTNTAQQPLYLLTIENTADTLIIDGEEYSHAHHSADDSRVYAYLTGTAHTVMAGKPYTYIFDGVSGFTQPDLNIYGDGIVYGEDFTYEGGVLTVRSDKAVTIENINPAAPTADSIAVKGAAANITLGGVNINAPAAFVSDGSAVSLTVKEGTDNILISGTDSAGIEMNGASLAISGNGRLNVTGGDNAPAISGGDVEITDTILEAAGGTGGSGISAASVVIGGASVSAAGGSGASAVTADSVSVLNGRLTASVIDAADIVIELGSVKGAPSTTPKNSGESVYLLVIPNMAGDPIEVDGEALTITRHGIGGDTNLYLYLTGESHTVRVGSNDTIIYVFDGSGFVEISGDLLVSGENVVYGTDYTYPANGGVLTILKNKPMTITSTVDVTSDVIVVAASAEGADITLDGVNISAVGTAALTVECDNASIKLAEGSTNVLTSDGAGISAVGSGTLSIGGNAWLDTGAGGISAAALTLDETAVSAGDITADPIIIKRGSVFAGSFSTEPTLDGETLHLYTIENTNGYDIFVDGEEYFPTQHLIGGDTNVYAYLTPEAHTIKVGDGDEKLLYYDAATDSFKEPQLLVTGVFGTDYTYDNNGNVIINASGSVTVSMREGVNSSTAKIIVNSGTVTLDRVSIHSMSGSAVEINGNATLLMKDINVLTSAGSAGISAAADKSLTIGGDGSVTASIEAADAAVSIGTSVTATSLNVKSLTVTGGLVKANIMAVGGELSISGGDVLTDAVSSFGLTITDGTLTSTNNIIVSGSADILGGAVAAATDITAAAVTIRDAAVTAVTLDSASIAIKGGSVLADSMTSDPTDGNGNSVYLKAIANTSGGTVLLNDDEYLPAKHSTSDSNIYTYLSAAEDWWFTVDGEETGYRYSAEKSRFRIIPTADMFTVELPADLVYNEQPKTVTVTPADSSMSITVNYSDADGAVAEAIDAGVYTFTVTVAGDDTYADETVSDAAWTFEITSAPLDAPEKVVYNVGFGYKAEDAVLDTTTGIMTAGANTVSGTWTLEFDGHFTESGEAFNATFTPDDTNYLSFACDYVQVLVNAIDPVVEADPEYPRAVQGKTVVFTVIAQHPKYPEFTESLPSQVTSLDDGNGVIAGNSYTVPEDAVIGSTITVTVFADGVAGRYNPSSAVSVITVDEKLNVDDKLSVETPVVTYGDEPQPQGVFDGFSDGEPQWAYSFAAGDVGVNGSYGTLDSLFNQYGALDVGTYSVKAEYEDAAHIGVGYGTFTVTAKKLDVSFSGDITKQYDGTKAVVGYTVDAADFTLSGLVGGAVRTIDTLAVTILYTDEAVGTDKELIIALVNDSYVLAEDGTEDCNYILPDSIGFIGAVIRRRDVTVTAEDKSKTYGDSDPALTYTAENLVQGESLTGELTREEGENAGSYEILQGTLTNENNASYNITYISAELTIGKAAASAVAGTENKHSWGATGGKSAAILGLPADAGELGYAVAEVSDPDGILSGTPYCEGGTLHYTLGSNTAESIGSTAVITVAVSTTNYEDIPVAVRVTLTEKQDQQAPPLKLSFTLDEDATFTAAIEPVEGAEYKFGDGEWSSVNYITGVAGSTFVTAYIRMAETETHNPSPIATVTEMSPKSAVATPKFTPAPGAFIGSMEVSISCATEGATIYYTINGDDPLEKGIEYTAPFTIERTITIKAVAVKQYMLDSAVAEGKFTRQPHNPTGGSGGGSGGGTGGGGTGGSGGSGGGGGGSFFADVPAVGGVNYNWFQIARLLGETPVGGEFEITLQGCTDIPAHVIQVIAERDIRVNFVYNGVSSWFVDGADIPEAEEYADANLSMIYPVRIMTFELRGKNKMKLRVFDTNLPAELRMDMGAGNAGEYINVYKLVDGVLVFVETVLIDENGIAALHLNELGDYALQLCKYTDLLGDADNNAVVNALDAAAILRHVVGLAEAANPEMGDFNLNSALNALDAADILSWIVGA